MVVIEKEQFVGHIKVSIVTDDEETHIATIAPLFWNDKRGVDDIRLFTPKTIITKEQIGTYSDAMRYVKSCYDSLHTLMVNKYNVEELNNWINTVEYRNEVK